MYKVIAMAILCESTVAYFRVAYYQDWKKQVDNQEAREDK